MRKDTTFSSEKLTQEEFSKKYWLNGEMPHQYHTANIEDGRDEREQFIFNNMVALYNLIRCESQQGRERRSLLEKDFCKQVKKITVLAVTNTIISAILAVTVIILRYKVG